MAYRDETEALRAQVVALEARVAELERENATLLDGQPTVRDTLFGKSLTVATTTKLGGWLPKKAARLALDRVESIVREPGNAVGGDELAVFRAAGRDLEISIRRDGESTVVRVAERISLVTGAMIGGVLGGGGGVLGLAIVAVVVENGSVPALLVVAPVWAALIYGIAHLLLRGAVKRHQRKVEEIERSLLANLPKTLPPAREA